MSNPRDRVSLGDNGTAPGRRLAFYCLGCKSAHSVVIETENGWTWNGSSLWPTLSPSVLVHSHRTFGPEGKIIDTPQCHSFIKQGQIEYLSDCTHELAGQTVDLPAFGEHV